MRPIAISLSPNTDRADVQRALSLLMRPSQWSDNGLIDQASTRISRLYGNYHTMLTSSGRQALYDILRALNVSQGDEVIVQAFTCLSVPAAVLWTGASPVYADINSKTYCLDPASVRERITSKTKAIIVQHTFGISGPIHEILEIAHQHQIRVIEDCAHAFDVSEGEGKLGMYGDAAFLSFGRDKCLSSVFGGAAITNNDTTARSLEAFQNERSYPPHAWVAQQLLHPLLFSIILPLYDKMSMGKILLRSAQIAGLLSKAVTIQERAGGKPSHISYRYSPALAQLLIQQIQTQRVHTKRRRAIVALYADALGFYELRDKSRPLLRFPIQVNHSLTILKNAQKAHMYLGDWYHAPLAPTCNLKEFKYSRGVCPNAERIAQYMINLPTNPSLTDKEVSNIISLVRPYVQHND